MAFTIIIDGENFISRLEDLGYSKEEILNEFVFEAFTNRVQEILKKNGLYSHPFLHTEFIYPLNNKLGKDFEDKNDMALTKLLNKIRNSRGVSLHPVDLKNRSGEAKGVDMEVSVCMFDIALNSLLPTGQVQHIVLVARDRDYAPILKLLRRIGLHTIVIGPRIDQESGKEFPQELINEAYLFVDLREICDKCFKRNNSK